MFNSGLENLFLLRNGKSRSINWENRNGEKGRGGMAASGLGQGRKGSPCVPVNAEHQISQYISVSIAYPIRYRDPNMLYEPRPFHLCKRHRFSRLNDRDARSSSRREASGLFM